MIILSIVKNGKPGSTCLTALCMLFLFSVLWCSSALGSINGVCSDCHTMHNSQNNAAMNFDGSATPNDNLTRGTCLGCHAQGGPSATVIQGTSVIPQVMHSGTTHLAGGNFGYITGMAGNGAADNKGHNIGTLTGTDGVLYGPPGGIVQSFHNTGYVVNTNNLTCAGTNGCHGYRLASSSLPQGISGSHHKNVDGQLDQADGSANSYRFLMGVKGFESADWQENASSGNHNEYFGLTAPIQLGCSSGATSCHGGASGVQPPDGTMSQFCATCHGNFHTLSVGAGNDSGPGNSSGVGVAAASPFIRHPTDLALPATGEYAAYTAYDLQSPVARITVPSAPNSGVTPGSDAVMCLSCHVSHASDYPSMLRWDYDDMIAGNGGAAADTGCFACHTTKD